MTPLHPNQLHLIRIHYAIGGLVLLVLVLAAEAGLLAEPRWPLPAGALTGIATLVILIGIWRLPRRRYAAWGYRLEEDELIVRHGLLVRMMTVVPFGRVQHIDVAQGPIARSLGLATLVLNTAGTRGAAVRLPGLAHADAEAMREHVRTKIRQDLV